MPIKELPPIEVLRNAFDVNVETGFIKNKRRKSPPSAHRATGYLRISHNGSQYAAHRIIWAIANNKVPPVDLQIDHINGDKLDNRICNLRLVTRTGNMRNTKAQKQPKNGHVGLYYRKDRKKWRAHINIDNKKIWLGCFNNKEDAINARIAAEKEYNFVVEEMD